MPSYSDIINAFDECREYVFGGALGRYHPHKSDRETAQRWLSAGVTLALATIVFHEQMTWMHEKMLRFGEGKERSYTPNSLKVFDENIAVALRRKSVGYVSDRWENELALWRARFGSWEKTGIWFDDYWGPPPDREGNRVPKSVLAR